MVARLDLIHWGARELGGKDIREGLLGASDALDALAVAAGVFALSARNRRGHYHLALTGPALENLGVYVVDAASN